MDRKRLARVVGLYNDWRLRDNNPRHPHQGTHLTAPARSFVAIVVVLLSIVLLSILSTARAADLGIFTDQCDVGKPSTLGPGSLSFDSDKKIYMITGGGENMWAAADHFHFVYKKITGDVALSAAIEFVGTSPATGKPDDHRKACLMIRQSLDSDAVYADAAAHGSGLTSLQWRDAKGAVTHEVQSNVVGPKKLRIEKRGNTVSMSIASADEELHPAGGSAKIEFTGDFYIGLAVSAHNVNRLETVAFSNVELGSPAPITGHTTLINTLQTINVQSKDRRVAYVVTQPGRIEAPNWFPDNSNTLYFNTNGKLYKVQAEPPGTPPNPNRKPVEQVDLGALTRINNDHGISPDGKMLAISDASERVNGQRPSLVYVIPIEGGQPKRLTETGPSYFHGWSPDGKTLAFCGLRDKNFDIYTIPVDGGPEKRLTTDAGKDDGPEFSSDGQSIYFNSDRTGVMQIWRMHADGSNAEQITTDTDHESWFPHISPNGRLMVFLSYDKGAGDHPENKDVSLQLMDLRSKVIAPLAMLFGGQGTINVSSWSPNSRYLAFVSYQIIPQ
jgi:TolB protein